MRRPLFHTTSPHPAIALSLPPSEAYSHLRPQRGRSGSMVKVQWEYIDRPGCIGLTRIELPWLPWLPWRWRVRVSLNKSLWYRALGLHRGGRGVTDKVGLWSTLIHEILHAYVEIMMRCGHRCEDEPAATRYVGHCGHWVDAAWELGDALGFPGLEVSDLAGGSARWDRREELLNQ